MGEGQLQEQRWVRVMVIRGRETHRDRHWENIIDGPGFSRCEGAGHRKSTLLCFKQSPAPHWLTTTNFVSRCTTSTTPASVHPKKRDSNTDCGEYGVHTLSSTSYR